jgi:hypothetical protein
MIPCPLLSFDNDIHMRDPHTGQRSFAFLRLVDKYDTLVGETDTELIEEFVSKSSEGCFFCPGKIESSTPMFIDTVLPEGRIKMGESTLFPNLFSRSTYYALIIPCNIHFLKPEGFLATRS